MGMEGETRSRKAHGEQNTTQDRNTSLTHMGFKITLVFKKFQLTYILYIQIHTYIKYLNFSSKNNLNVSGLLSDSAIILTVINSEVKVHNEIK